MKHFLLVLCTFFAYANVAQAQPKEIKGDSITLGDTTFKVVRPSDDSKLVQVDESAFLQSRVYMYHPEQFDGDCVVDLDWRWWENTPAKKFAEENADDYADFRRQIADHLLIILRTDGELQTERSWESLNCVKVVINAGYGEISIVKSIDGKNEVIASTHITANLAEVKLEKSISQTEPAIMSGWYHVKVSLRGDKLAAYLQPRKKGELPVKVIEASVSAEGLGGKQVAVANREIINNVPSLTQIKRLTVAKP